VLVTSAPLRRLQGEGIADKELSALLARDLLVPVVHGTTYEAFREVTPVRLAKRPEYYRKSDGRRRGQARRTGRHLVTINALVSIQWSSCRIIDNPGETEVASVTLICVVVIARVPKSIAAF
jgi:hypothetical protein